MTAQVETHSFQAEVQSLLNLMIHSLYSNKEIFLRELVSNGSDALDKFRFAELTNRNLLPSSRELGVLISADKDNRKLIIEDNGIGMNRDDLINNLGTIANSGTKKFLEKLGDAEKKDANLIGQFGVGFYAAFMVSESIKVESLSAEGGESCIWESTGNGSYTLAPGTRTERGTRIEITLKEDDVEFADDWRIKGIVHKYSDYVTYPILFKDKENKEDRLNKSTPVWARNKRENKPEEYIELYKQISRDFRDPLFHEHISTEGLMPFNAVVFVPSEAPFDLWQRDTHGLHLYVKRVSIAEQCKELIPEYLRFVKGVVETDELPLNVSREILQQNTKLPTIKKQIVKKVLGSLTQMATNDAEKFQKFYTIFGPVLKEGFHFDHDNHESLATLVRFRSSRTGSDGWVSLKEYVERMAPNQKDIYFITGSSAESVGSSPHLEALKSRDIEVLFLTDAIDEWFVMDYPRHGEFELKSITKGDIDLNGIGKDVTTPSENETPAEDLAPLMETLRLALANEIKDVRITRRLTESACCLVADENGLSAQMERLMKANNKDFAGAKKILEVNPSHPLIKNLANLQKKGENSARLGEWVEVLYETALLAEGSPVKDPGMFARKLTRIMEQASMVH